jgi:flagellar basal-body rod modification protein FlgD
MTIATVSPTAAASSTAGQNSTASSVMPSQTLNQADFLKLLTVQLSQQDPMQPMDDTAFVAQMAQFTSLQQTSDIDTQITSLNSNNAIQTATGLIGTNVTLQTNSGPVSGPVQSVDNSTGTVQLNVNGSLYPLSQVIDVTPPPSTTTTQP